MESTIHLPKTAFQFYTGISHTSQKKPTFSCMLALQHLPAQAHVPAGGASSPSLRYSRTGGEGPGRTIAGDLLRLPRVLPGMQQLASLARKLMEPDFLLCCGLSLCLPALPYAHFSRTLTSFFHTFSSRHHLFPNTSMHHISC